MERGRGPTDGGAELTARVQALVETRRRRRGRRLVLLVGVATVLVGMVIPLGFEGGSRRARMGPPAPERAIAVQPPVVIPLPAAGEPPVAVSRGKAKRRRRPQRRDVRERLLSADLTLNPF